MSNTAGNTEQATELLPDDYGCECHGCMKYGEECHGLTSAADKFLTAETAAIRAERDEALRVLRALVENATAMKEAIATCSPMEFGIGGGNGDTHWFIRDELIGRSDKALAAADAVLEGK